MQVKTILNRVQKFKSFVDSAVRWVEAPGGEPAIEAELRPRTGVGGIVRDAAAGQRATIPSRSGVLSVCRCGVSRCIFVMRRGV